MQGRFTVEQIICGVDVSSKSLDTRLGLDGIHRQFMRTSEGIVALAEFCREHRVTLVAMEATGGYEALPYTLLWAHGLEVCIVNARHVRHFAEALGRLEKTDKIDAGVIAEFAKVRGLVGKPPASDKQKELKALVAHLRQLICARTVQKNQSKLVDEPLVIASRERLIASLNKEIRHMESLVAERIEDDPLWAKLDTAFREIKGVSYRTVACLMAELPEIGTCSSKSIAKLAGLAPIAKDSGKSSGKRPVRGGRVHVRTILFTVAELVRRYNKTFTEAHQRLLKAGKPRMVVRIALARKLIVVLNAKARDAREEMKIAT